MPEPRSAISQVNEPRPPAVGRLERAAGRHQKRERRRLERHHRLGDQDQPIGVRVGKNGLRHVVSWHAAKEVLGPASLAARTDGLRAVQLRMPYSVECGLGVRNLDGLVDGARLGETQALIQANGAVILGRDFQEGAAQSGLLKSFERLDAAGRCQAAGRDARA